MIDLTPKFIAFNNLYYEHNELCENIRFSFYQSEDDYDADVLDEQAMRAAIMDAFKELNYLINQPEFCN